MMSILQMPGQQMSPARKKRRSTGRSGDGVASSPSNDSDNSVPGIKRDKLYMPRSKRDEVLKQRISESTGMPPGEINAQNSR